VGESSKVHGTKVRTMQKFGQVTLDSNSDILCAWYKYVTLIFSKPQAEARRIRRALSKATRQAAILLKIN
jgi:hypothetical protein